MKTKTLAIITDQLAGGIGGAESILFCAMDLFPQAPVYTTVLNRDIIPSKYNERIITPSFIQNLPFAKRKYKAYFPLMPLAVEYFNLQEFDIIFSSHHSVAKGIIPRPDAVHICYCHSPARYIWDMFWTYSDLNNTKGTKRLLTALISQYLRIWDVTSSNRVDYYLANSNYTAKRIKKFYNRDSEVLFPPVNTDCFQYEDSHDYYLMVGRLAAYKGFELAIDAFNESGKRLVIVGDGAEAKRLRAKAGKNIEMPGKVSLDELKNYMNNCRGFIFPGKEDFGIVMAEAQSAGKPVIAFKGGGALDIVADGETGILFNEQSTSSLNNAVNKSENTQWDYKLIREHSLKFDKQKFEERLKYIIDNAEEFRF